MVRIFKVDIEQDRRKTIGVSLYYILSTCVDGETNMLKINGRPMNTMDICAYANYTRKELSKAIRTLYYKGIILNVRTGGKDLFFINPEFVRDENKTVLDFPFLNELFDGESNMDVKDLVYFRKGHRKISIDIGSVLPEVK
jgi:hypothetical protein